MINLMLMGGIHGVGKTTFCKSLAEITGYTHATASQLIKEQNATALNENSKIVKDADYNQKLLIAAVKDRQTSGQKLILDGHFTLQTVNGIQKIDTSIFQSIGVEAISVLIDAPEIIAKRVEQRDGKQLSISDIADHQRQEIEAAENVSKQLGVSFKKLSADEEATRLLFRLLSN